MNRRRLLWAALAVAVLSTQFATRPASAFPEPSRSPIAWELKFDATMPHRIIVDIPGQPTAKAYWYVTYTITNHSDEDITFLPTFEWVTNEGKVVRSDRNVPHAVFDKIKAMRGNQLMEDSVKITGVVHQGDDQAKDGVAIWEEPEARLGNFSIFVTGLSGESVQLSDAAGKPMADADGKPVLLFKTLQLNYKVAGDEVYAGNDLLTKIDQKWVMR